MAVRESSDTRSERVGEAPTQEILDLDRMHVEYQQTGDPVLRERLLAEYQRLACHFARRFSRRGEPLEDLEQVATIAVLKALDRFDPSRDVKFSAYASRVISGELKRHFRDRTWAMRVPRALQELHLRAKNATELLRGDLGRSPSVPELAQYLGVTDEMVLEAMEVGGAYRLASLDAPIAGSEDRHTQVGGDDPGLYAFEQRQMLEPLLARLGDDDRLIVRLYYVHNLSQAEIGARLGLSQVHVSRRLARILTRLRALAGVDG